MCSGQVPFPTPSLPEKLFAHQAMEPTPLAQVVHNLPAGLSEVIQRMMHKLPDERYATPLQVAQALESFETEYSVAIGRDDAERATSETGATYPEALAARADAELLKVGPESAKPGLAVAESVRLKTPPDPAVDHNAGPSAQLPSTVFSPESGQGSDPEFPLDLILAPEPSLTEGLSRPKTRSGLSNSETSSEGNSLLRLPRHWLWVLLAIAMTVLASVMVLAIFDPFADTRAAPRKPGPSLPTDKTGSLSKSPEATDEASSSPTQAPDSLPPIVVRADGEVDRPFAADKLFDAMKNAMVLAAGSNCETANP